MYTIVSYSQMYIYTRMYIFLYTWNTDMDDLKYDSHDTCSVLIDAPCYVDWLITLFWYSDLSHTNTQGESNDSNDFTHLKCVILTLFYIHLNEEKQERARTEKMMNIHLNEEKQERARSEKNLNSSSVFSCVINPLLHSVIYKGRLVNLLSQIWPYVRPKATFSFLRLLLRHPL